MSNPEYHAPELRNRELDELAAAGVGWVRFDIKWSDVQWHGADSFDWAKYDPLVDGARARGLSVLANLAYSPTWARDAGTSDKFAPDSDPRRAAFARFAAAAVSRYRGRVGHWEVWNEVNSPIFWRPAPSPAGYTALLAAAYPAMKQADPGAFVLAGATAPAGNGGGWIDEVAFLQGVYAAGGGRFFDGWSHHPYDFVVGPGGQHPDSGWDQMHGTSPSIRSVMAANGDAAKPVWATESGAPSAGTWGGIVFSEALQAEHIRKAHAHWLTYAWGGVIFTYTSRDLAGPGQADYWAYTGLVRSDFSRKPAWFAVRSSTG
jgi:hypothetical protein